LEILNSEWICICISDPLHAHPHVFWSWKLQESPPSNLPKWQPEAVAQNGVFFI